MDTVVPPRCTIVHGVTAAVPSPDDADTLAQADEISAILRIAGWAVDVLPLGLDLSPLSRLAGHRPDLVFNLVEALAGAGRLVHVVPAVLETYAVPMTGCSSTALFSASNKPYAKRLMRDAGIPTPQWCDLAHAPVEGGRWIVKSVWEHASIGLDAGSVVEAGAVAATLHDRAARFGGEWFAERFIEGREFNVSLLAGLPGTRDPQVLPVAEMTFVDYPPDVPRIVDYAAKWDASSPAYHNTVRRFDLPPRDRALAAMLADIACDCWHCFALAGYARVDFRVDAGGQPWVLEVNANPCLAADAGFIAAAAQAGLSQAEVVMRLLAAAGVPAIAASAVA